MILKGFDDQLFSFPHVINVFGKERKKDHKRKSLPNLLHRKVGMSPDCPLSSGSQKTYGHAGKKIKEQIA